MDYRNNKNTVKQSKELEKILYNVICKLLKLKDKIMNMSYCRFQNTFEDLIDCKDALYNGDIERTEEKRYAKKLIALCKEIAENFEDEDLD